MPCSGAPAIAPWPGSGSASAGSTTSTRTRSSSPSRSRRAGGVAEDATAELVIVPIRGHCPDCGSSFEADEPVLCCPDCGALGVEQEGGDELILELIEYRA